MNDVTSEFGNEQLTDEQRRALDRGLAEFDRSIRRRRSRRRALSGTLATLAVVVVALIATRVGLGPNRDDARTLIVRSPLPAYVELIRDDAQLTLELELASACERIGRQGGEIYVVECARPAGVR
jgi:hypothetical protein